MTTKEIQERIFRLIQELTAFYGEISGELEETDSRAWLRFVKNEPRAGSELKKMPRKYLTFRA
ncbi:MAG: hypothetical protein K2L67_06815 [Clostridia bacterium]|nr:hypothetical protein [Clostridia bacterium]